MVLLLRSLSLALFGAMVVGAPFAASHLLRAGWSERAIVMLLTPVSLVIVLVARWLLHLAYMRRRDVDPVL